MPLGIAPKGLDAVDMVVALGKFVLTVLNTKMLGITDINQAVVASPAIGVNNTVNADAASNHLLQHGFRCIRNNLGKDFAIALKNTKYDGFT